MLQLTFYYQHVSCLLSISYKLLIDRVYQSDIMINEVIEMTETNKQQEHRIKQHLAKIQHRIHEDRAKLDREEVILNRAKKRHLQLLYDRRF